MKTAYIVIDKNDNLTIAVNGSSITIHKSGIFSNQYKELTDKLFSEYEVHFSYSHDTLKYDDINKFVNGELNTKKQLVSSVSSEKTDFAISPDTNLYRTVEGNFVVDEKDIEYNDVEEITAKPTKAIDISDPRFANSRLVQRAIRAKILVPTNEEELASLKKSSKAVIKGAKSASGEDLAVGTLDEIYLQDKSDPDEINIGGNIDELSDEEKLINLVRKSK